MSCTQEEDSDPDDSDVEAPSLLSGFTDLERSKGENAEEIFF